MTPPPDRTRTRTGRLRIAVDMDEVIADAVSYHLGLYNRDYGTKFTVADLHGCWLGDLVPQEHLPVLAGYVHSGDFFRSLAVVADAQAVLTRLAEHFDIFIATAAMEVPESFAAKFEWLAEHFPAIRPSHIVFCGDKSIIDADFLVDDNPRQLRLFGGQGVLFSSPSNALLADHGFPRVANWLEAERYFQQFVAR